MSILAASVFASLWQPAVARVRDYRRDLFNTGETGTGSGTGELGHSETQLDH